MQQGLTTLLQASPIDWQLVLAFIINKLDCSTGTIHKLDPETNLLKITAHQGIPPQILPIIDSIPIGKGIAGAAAETREPVELCNLQQDLGGVAKEKARQTQVQGSIAVPIELNGALLGTLGIGKLIPHNFSDLEKSTLKNTATQIANHLTQNL